MKSIRRTLRKLLGLDDDIKDLLRAIDVLRQDLAVMRSDFTMTIGADEFDPRRRAASNHLGVITMKRLAAEDRARKQTTGEWTSEDEANFWRMK